MATSSTSVAGNKGVLDTGVSNNPSSELAALLNKSLGNGSDTPFEIKYIRNLISAGGVSIREIKQILTCNPGNGGIYALFAYALARRTIKKGNISAHYLHYLRTMADQILAGRLRCKRADSSLAAENVFALYDMEKNELIFDPEQIKALNNQTLFESTVIHELWHAWQKFNNRSLPYSLYEVEAHFAQADYLYHRSPNQLQEKYWLYTIINRQQGMLSFKFLPPKEAVIKAGNLPLESSGYKAILNEARNYYLLARITVDAKNMETIQRLLGQLPQGAPFFAVVRGLVELTDKTEAKLLQKPFSEHFNCDRPKAASGSKLSTCHVTEDMSNYSSGVWALSIYLFQQNRADKIAPVANIYFIEAFKSQNLVGNPDMDFTVSAPK